MIQNISVPKNGYIYVYCSNESNINVYFDNLEVIHTRGQILEETHYYPFGLTMSGISSKAAGGMENNKKFVGQEFDIDFGWNTYQFRFRTHDPQLGRFLQIDPLATQYVYNSTYAYAENDVIRAIDVEGLEKYIKIISNLEPPHDNAAVVKKTIFTKTDKNGNLVDQNLVEERTNKILTEGEAYTYNSTDGGNDGPSKATAADKFIVKNGIKHVENGPAAANDITDKTTVLGHTDPVELGEKLITSEGYANSNIAALVDKRHTNEEKVAGDPKAIIDFQKKDLTDVIGKDKVKIAVIVTVNPQNKAFARQVQSIKGEPGLTVVKDKNQDVNTFNITIVGVKQ